MKKITNTYTEPLPIYLLRSFKGKKVRDRTVVNLAVGASILVEDEEVSSELERLRKKRRLKLETVVEVPPEKKEDVAPVQEVAPVVEDNDEDLEKLEQELLSDDEESEDE